MSTIQMRSTEMKAWEMLMESLKKYMDSCLSDKKPGIESILSSAEQFKAAHMERISKDIPAKKT